MYRDWKDNPEQNGGSKIMGLGASQARYLGLTARQSNIEFQGQQINQQRTVLANESSSYNAQLLSMNVPTAPNSSNYTKTSYTFSSNSLTCSLASGGVVYNDKTGKYTVPYTYKTTEDAAKSGSATYSKLTSTTTDPTTGQPVTTVTGYSTSSGTNLTLVDGSDKSDVSNLTLIFGSDYAKDDQGDPVSYFKYTSNGTTRYVKQSDLDEKADTATNMPFYYVQEDATVTKDGKFENCSVNWNDSGRMTSFSDSEGNEYALSTTTTTDENAYNDAMNQYEYDKAVYDQQINEINAKLDIVQQQDKTLELQLKQLDTEQAAVSTEKEAVNKVIEKNTESTFKTFA